MEKKKKKRKISAEKFAEEIRKLAETGCIESLSITIHGSGESLFQSSQAIGIKDFSIIALFGA